MLRNVTGDLGIKIKQKTNKKMLGISFKSKDKKELEESEQRFRSIVEQAQDGIFIHDLKGNIVDANKKACKNLGYSKRQLLKLKVKDVDPDFIKRARRGKFWKELKKKKYITFEGRHLKRNGQEIEVEVTLGPLDYSDKKLVIAITRDITEEKKLNKRLAEVVGHSSHVHYVHDANQVIQYISPQCENFFGYTQKEMERKWTDLMTNNPINKKGLEFTDKAFKTGKKQKPYLLELKRKDGNKILVEVKESPLRDKNGKVVGVVGALTDVTERTKAQKALEESEEKFRNYIEHAPYGIFVINGRGKILEINKAGYEMGGYSKEEIVSKGMFNFVPKEEYSKVFEGFKKVKKHGEFADLIKYKRKNSKELGWMDISVVALRNNLFLAFFSDATESVLAEERLKESEEECRLLAENNVDVIWKMDLRFNFTYVNSAIENLTGHKVDEWVGTNLKEHSDEHNFKIMSTAMKKTLKNYLKSESVIFEATIFRKDKTSVDVEVHAKMVLGEDGVPISFQGMARDITKRRKSEEALREKVETLEKFSSVTVNREVKMVELKNRIAELEQELAKYTKK